MARIPAQAVVTGVSIDPQKLWRQLMAAGGTGGLGAYRDELCQEICDQGYLASPVNDPLNAKHRGGEVGTYKRSWFWHRRNAYAEWRVGGRAGNTAGHAIYLERGRKRSSEPQYFSWKRYGGHEMWWVGKKDSPLKYTKARKGRHIVRNATRMALMQHAALCARARANNPYQSLMNM